MMNTSIEDEKQPEQKPLVTFALFTYNQEQFVRDAVEGAFSQTYEPLEIILSDDFSTDRTFEIMREMAAEYRGPHRIVLRQSEINFGTAAHVQAVANKMTGELLIVAAGDDISLPERTSLTVDAWLASNRRASVLHGKAIAIDALTKCEVSHINFNKKCDVELHLDWFVHHKWQPFQASTCAYARSIFANYPPLVGGSLVEDMVLTPRCFFEGTAVPVLHNLILRRTNYQSSSTGMTYKDPWHWNQIFRSRIIGASNCVQDLAFAKNIGIDSRKILEQDYLRIVRNLSLFILPTTHQLGFWERIRMAFRLILFYPTNQGIHRRIYMGLSFCGFVTPGLLNLKERLKFFIKVKSHAK